MKSDGDERTPMRERAREQWEWRIGPEATTHRQKLAIWLIRGWFLYLAAFVLVVVGVKAKVPVIWIIGVVAFGGAITCNGCSWVEWARMRRAISRTLGIPASWRNLPPRPVAQYLAWCEKNNLQPYPFRSPGSG